MAPTERPPVRVTVVASPDDGSMRLFLTHDRAVTKAVLRQGNRLEVVYTEPVVFNLPEIERNSLLRSLNVKGRRLMVRLGPDFDSYENFNMKNPERLIIDLSARVEGASSSGGIGKRGRVRKNPDDDVIVIVIDPGHGGSESGASSETGLLEKRVTLTLARGLRRRLLTNKGIRVVLTRDEDRTLALDERTAIANQNRADLFLSLHLNASPRTNAYGAETYFLSTEATDDAARTTAALENRSYSKGDTDDLDLLLWDLAQNRHLARSSALAEAIQGQMNALVGTRDRGVRQAPFRVLMGATMPAVLVEVGFISNPDESERLRDALYQDRIVESLARAIESYLVDWRRLQGRTPMSN
jgi:N-acetylmuramoyl-L-alanine amidase